MEDFKINIPSRFKGKDRKIIKKARFPIDNVTLVFIMLLIGIISSMLSFVLMTYNSKIGFLSFAISMSIIFIGIAIGACLNKEDSALSFYYFKKDSPEKEIQTKYQMLKIEIETINNNSDNDINKSTSIVKTFFE